MEAAVDAGEQHGVHLRQQFVDRTDDLDLPLVLQLFGEAVDARAAFLDIGAPAFVRCNYARAGYMIGRRGVIQDFGEGGHVRGVGADDADAQVGCGSERGQRKEQRDGFHYPALYTGACHWLDEYVTTAPGGRAVPAYTVETSTPLQYVKGIGPGRAEMLATKGLTTVEDLLTYAPFRYEDR